MEGAELGTVVAASVSHAAPPIKLIALPMERRDSIWVTQRRLDHFVETAVRNPALSRWISVVVVVLVAYD